MRRYAWVGWLCLTACSGSPGADGGTGGGAGGGTGGGGGLAALSESEYCAQREEVSCQYQVRCGFAETLAGCLRVAEQQRVEYRYDECTVGRAATADGRQAFDGASARRCIDWLKTAACDPTGAANDCTTVFRPAVSDGGACFDTRECAEGTSCRTASTCPGTCQPRSDGSAPLAPGQACDEGLYTAVVTPLDGGVGLELWCRPPGYQPCAVGNPLACPASEACDAASLRCVPALGAGEPCGLTADGGTGLCQRNLLCQPTTSGVRRCGPLAGLGEPCGQCKSDLRCLRDGGADGTCAPKGETGAPCATLVDCAFGFFCLSSSGMPLGPGTCQPRLPAGARCTGRPDCALGLDCLFTAPGDGGTFPELRCAPGDGGTGTCGDPTP